MLSEEDIRLIEKVNPGFFIWAETNKNIPLLPTEKAEKTREKSRRYYNSYWARWFRKYKREYRRNEKLKITNVRPKGDKAISPMAIYKIQTMAIDLG